MSSESSDFDLDEDLELQSLKKQEIKKQEEEEASAPATKENESSAKFWIVASVCSSVGLIMTNKYVMKTYDFQFIFTLTFCHFMAQACLLEFLARSGGFVPKRMSTRDNIACGFMMVGSVAFMNFSLNANSVGFYQITKLACIPTMVAIQIVYYGVSFSFRIKMILAVIFAGVGITYITDVEFNTLGCVYGVLAVLATTLHQVWTGSMQKSYGLKGNQFPHSLSPSLACIVFVLAAIFEIFPMHGAPSVLDHQFQRQEVVMIGISCLLAISVNIASAGVIRVTSPVTYQVVGHAKTTLVLMGGFLLFPLPDNTTSSQMLMNLAGIAVAFVGVIVYGKWKMEEAQAQK